jgi:hypothetical protein
VRRMYTSPAWSLLAPWRGSTLTRGGTRSKPALCSSAARIAFSAHHRARRVQWCMETSFRWARHGREAAVRRSRDGCCMDASWPNRPARRSVKLPSKCRRVTVKVPSKGAFHTPIHPSCSLMGGVFSSSPTARAVPTSDRHCCGQCRAVWRSRPDPWFRPGASRLPL